MSVKNNTMTWQSQSWLFINSCCNAMTEQSCKIFGMQYLYLSGLVLTKKDNCIVLCVWSTSTEAEVLTAGILTAIMEENCSCGRLLPVGAVVVATAAWNNKYSLNIIIICNHNHLQVWQPFDCKMVLWDATMFPSSEITTFNDVTKN